jgi:hypothetical protein
MLEPTGTPGEYRRRGVAQIPVADGMAEDRWEIGTVTIV